MDECVLNIDVGGRRGLDGDKAAIVPRAAATHTARPRTATS